MSAQENARQSHKPSTSEPVEQQTTSVTSNTAALDADVDSILDEIDAVLEENAEDFVKSFVQKGGQ